MSKNKTYLSGLLTKSYVYAYHVPTINSIKIGFGIDPRKRMSEYCKAYDLKPDESSLITWELPSPSVASMLETAIHRGLRDSGFFEYGKYETDIISKELFLLCDNDYKDVVIYVSEIIDLVLTEIISGINVKYANANSKKFTNADYLRKKQKKKSENIIYDAKYSEDATIKKQKEIEKYSKIHKQYKHQFEIKYREGWGEHVFPWYNSKIKAHQIIDGYRLPGFFRTINWTTKDYYNHFVAWSRYPELLLMTIDCFKNAWLAMAFVSSLRKNFPNVRDFLYEIPDDLKNKSPQYIDHGFERVEQVVYQAFIDAFGKKMATNNVFGNRHLVDKIPSKMIIDSEKEIVQLLTVMAGDLPKLPRYLNMCGNDDDKIVC